jgi:hypothetical protein
VSDAPDGPEAEVEKPEVAALYVSCVHDGWVTVTLRVHVEVNAPAPDWYMLQSNQFEPSVDGAVPLKWNVNWLPGSPYEIPYHVLSNDGITCFTSVLPT